MNIKEISEKSGLPYSTTRKYLVLLEDEKLLESQLKDGSRVFSNDAVRYVKRIARMSKDGLSLPDAIEKIRITPYSVSDDPEIAGLEKRLEEMRKSIEVLSGAVLNQQKALPEQSGFWYHLKAAFRSLFKRK